MNVVVPMAGSGTMLSHGERVPRWFADIGNKKLFIRATDKIDPGARVHFLIKRGMYDKYGLSAFRLIKSRFKEGKMVVVEKNCNGLAEQIFSASEHIDNDDPLLVIDPNYLCDIEPHKLRLACSRRGYRGIIVVGGKVNGSPPQYFVTCKRDESKVPIVSYVDVKGGDDSYPAAGVYYWQFGYEFVNYCRSVLRKKHMINGRYDIANVYNEAAMNDVRFGIHIRDTAWHLRNVNHVRAFMGG